MTAMMRLRMLGMGASLTLIWATSSAISGAIASEPARVYQIRLERLVDKRADLLVTLFVRGGQSVFAIARAPDVSPHLHSVDLTPPAPIEYLLDGQRFDPPEHLKGPYDYKKEEFLKYRKLYEQGRLVMRNYDTPPPLSFVGDSLSGVLDVFLSQPDFHKRKNLRIKVSLVAHGKGELKGDYQAFAYNPRDEEFRPLGEIQAGQATAVEAADFWSPSPDSAFAPGSDWPQTHGPDFTGAAPDCSRPFVDNLADARLLWVADWPFPAGRGKIPRSPFGFYPLTDTGLGTSQFSAPIVANGKVYLAVPYVDEDALAQQMEAFKKNPRVIRGVDPRALAADLALFRDTLFCIDARTGRTLWIFSDARHSTLLGAFKSGRALTAAYIDGKIVFRGQSSLYGVDAETGKLLWRNDGVVDRRGNSGYSFGPSYLESVDDSVVVIGGVIVTRINDTPKPPEGGSVEPWPRAGTTLVGIDPADGRLLWRVRNVAGTMAIPVGVTLQGKPYVLAAYAGVEGLGRIPPEKLQPKDRGLLTLIEPRTGEIVWQLPVAGPTASYPIVWNDIVALNVEREKIEPDKKGKPAPVKTLGAVRVAPNGASLLWARPELHWQDGRQTPIAHRGLFFTDVRTTGFSAVKAESGEILARWPLLHTWTYGSHNWSWLIAGNGRVIGSGRYLVMFRVEGEKVELVPGQLPVDLASGYLAPIRPALSDGRLIVRTSEGLVCYDLRKPKQQVDTMVLKSEALALGMADGGGGVDLQLRMVNGKPQTLLTRFPPYQETGVPRAFAWGGVSPMRWRAASALGLQLEGARIHGEPLVAVNDHREPWVFDLRVDGDAVTGTVERIILAAKEPQAVQGDIDGEVSTLSDGRIRYLLRLIGGGRDTRGNPRDITLVIERLHDRSTLSYGAAGDICSAAFEVDAKGLTWRPDGARGEVAVIMHCDRYIYVHPNFCTSLAANYLVDFTVALPPAEGKQIHGTFKGTIGIEFRRRATVQGKRYRNRDAEPMAEAVLAGNLVAPELSEDGEDNP